ncbi:hypothetical protein CCR75_002301 [Bremia lactucae]|uniref:Uncharacterized protein n=1 Tax=Bremia lactucae TaxID=4779 RepID=A0A976IC23_BRELC|nr:hypothetical protein CCR75_002301 [Bremia lactucae]
MRPRMATASKGMKWARRDNIDHRKFYERTMAQLGAFYAFALPQALRLRHHPNGNVPSVIRVGKAFVVLFCRATWLRVRYMATRFLAVGIRPFFPAWLINFQRSYRG